MKLSLFLVRWASVNFVDFGHFLKNRDFQNRHFWTSPLPAGRKVYTKVTFRSKMTLKMALFWPNFWPFCPLFTVFLLILLRTSNFNALFYFFFIFSSFFTIFIMLWHFPWSLMGFWVEFGEYRVLKRGQIWVIFGSFLTHFWVIFDPFLGHFWSFLTTFFMTFNGLPRGFWWFLVVIQKITQKMTIFNPVFDTL